MKISVATYFKDTLAQKVDTTDFDLSFFFSVLFFSFLSHFVAHTSLKQDKSWVTDLCSLNAMMQPLLKCFKVKWNNASQFAVCPLHYYYIIGVSWWHHAHLSNVRHFLVGLLPSSGSCTLLQIFFSSMSLSEKDSLSLILDSPGHSWRSMANLIITCMSV